MQDVCIWRIGGVKGVSVIGLAVLPKVFVSLNEDSSWFVVQSSHAFTLRPQKISRADCGSRRNRNVVRLITPSSKTPESHV